MNYTIQNLSSYHSYMMKSRSEFRAKELLSELYSFISLLESDERDFLFNNTITYNTHELNGTLISNNMSMYQGFFLMTATRIVDMAQKNLEDLLGLKNFRDIAYFTENMMNFLPMAYRPFGNLLFDMQTKHFSDFLVVVLKILVSALSLIVIMVIISSWIVFSIRIMFKEIYDSFLNINEGEFDERVFQLNMISDAMSKFKQSCFFKDFMGLNLTDNLKTNANKSTKKRVDKKYCFGLLLSILQIIIFYILQICYSGVIIAIHSSNINKGLWMVHKQKSMNALINNQVLLKNALSQKLILGENTKAMNQSVNEFISQEILRIRTTSYDMFSQTDDVPGEASFYELQNYLKKISNNTLCELDEFLEDKQEMCEFLDNKIPSNGVTQVYFRITQYLDEAFNLVQKGKIDPITLLNEPQYVEFDYTFENVYMPTLMNIEHEIHKGLEKFLELHLTEKIDLIIRFMIISILLSFFFVIYGFFQISNQIAKVVFSFQLLSINTVLNNTVVKFWFLKVHGLNQKTF